MATRAVEYEGIEIEYELTRKDVKYINLRVNKKGEVVVSAAKRVPVQVIDEFVQSKAQWIITHVAEIERIISNLPMTGFYAGKTVYYLGKPYRLEILQGEPDVELEGDEILLTCPKTTENALEEEYLSWLKEQAKPKFQEIMDRIIPLVRVYNIERPEIIVRSMTQTWGSCTVNGNSVRLNVRLMKATEDCIEMVVLHELLHFKFPNHDKVFYEKLDELMPDWKDRSTRLDSRFKDGI